MEERQEIVWASALSCLFYFVCDGGKIIRSRLGGLDIRVNITFFKFTFAMFRNISYFPSIVATFLSPDCQHFLLRIVTRFCNT